MTRVARGDTATVSQNFARRHLQHPDRVRIAHREVLEPCGNHRAAERRLARQPWPAIGRTATHFDQTDMETPVAFRQYRSPDSEANSVWFIEAPGRIAFLSDLVLNGPHSTLPTGICWPGWRISPASNGSVREWRWCTRATAPPSRRRSSSRLSGDYLLTLAAHVKELAEGRPSLSEEAKARIVERMTARYPAAGLTFLIPMNLDPIARELAAV
jgi:hypothetical protein